jgi:3-oxoacyl-[acyl-carrier protein] reductase
MELNLDGQVAVVTGASRGIGKAIATLLAKHGARVACVATTLEGAQATAGSLENASAYACDVSDAASVEALAEAVTGQSGAPAILVNNAGITRDTLIMRMKDEDWDKVLDVNLKGAFLTVRAFSRAMMKARYGRIVNVSSIIGQTGAAGQANYAAAKAGLIGLTKSIAKEYGSRGITCNAVAPGFIETDMTADLPAEVREHVLKTAPAGRLGTGEDIANAVLFLASPQSAYITGQTLTVDGGLTL